MVLSEAAAAFADGQRVGRLATADTGAVPHVVPFCYARDGDRFYFVVDEKPKRGPALALKRLRNIAANPRVAFVIDSYDEDWSRLAYLLVRGDAESVGDRAEYAEALALLRRRYPQYRSMTLELPRHPMVRITSRWFHLWRGSQ
jgi:PPOX class probable F420-dependent enzyme